MQKGVCFGFCPDNPLWDIHSVLTRRKDTEVMHIMVTTRQGKRSSYPIETKSGRRQMKGAQIANQ
jgi:hypothetical protein